MRRAGAVNRSPSSLGGFCVSCFERTTAMRSLGQHVVNFLKREDGPTAVEYAVMLALIIVVCLTAITTLGSNANATFTSVGNKIVAS
jgi:pilus assembly protein Flp/PilA